MNPPQPQINQTEHYPSIADLHQAIEHERVVREYFEMLLDPEKFKALQQHELERIEKANIQLYKLGTDHERAKDEIRQTHIRESHRAQELSLLLSKQALARNAERVDREPRVKIIKEDSNATLLAALEWLITQPEKLARYNEIVVSRRDRQEWLLSQYESRNG